MDKSLFLKRVAALRQRLADMPNADCDTAWIIQPENRRYLSGFTAGDPQITESSGSLLINETRCVLVTDSRYESSARNEVIGFEVHAQKRGLIEILCELVRELGTLNLGFEEDFLTIGLHGRLYDRFKELSPPVRLTPLNGIVEKMRQVKCETEIKALEASADLMSEILQEIIPSLKPGLTEKEVAWRIECLVHESEADGLAFPSIVASGPNSALPHAVPTERKLGTDEPVILDVGVRLDGYCSDMTRTVFLGEPQKELKTIYRTVRQAQIAALKEIRSGVVSDYPDSIARQIISDAGFGEYFGHGLGHGVGLATHESPRLSPLKPAKLLSGMVVTVEPGIYIPGKGGVRLEEMVVIGEDGPRVLTKVGHFYDF